MPTWLLVVAVIGGVLGGAGGIAALLIVPGQLRKLRGEGSMSEAEAESKISDAWLKLLKPAREEIGRLDTQLSRANEKLDRANFQIETLTSEVSSLRGQIFTMSKDLQASHDEVRQLRGEN